jgi:asparagine synthase (glutamine-hydrolysing)
MCGISGVAGRHDTEAVESVRRMVAALHHRGPDADAAMTYDRCVLGHDRLSIIDLSPLGVNPMANEDGTVWVVYNGELYNHRELRAALERAGHTFRSQTDTEVLVHLWELHGEEMVHKLRGIYAFGIWDTKTRTLFLCRDRLGVKPLYVRHDGDALWFASEARALARPGDRYDDTALTGLLRLGWVPGPRTVYEAVEELPPGSWLRWRDGEQVTRRWWSPSCDGPAADVADLREALRDAVARQVIADRPVGLFLSSGVDSVAVASVASDVAPDLRTFTVAFDEGADEGDAAARVARDLGLPHTVVRLSGSDVQEALDKIVADMDQPTVDGVNSWVISKAIREAGMVVALSGLGGDELFQGYSTFRHVPRIAEIAAKVAWVPGRRTAFATTRALPGLRHHRAQRAAEAVLGGGLPAAYAAVRGLFSSAELARLRPGHPLTPVIHGGDSTTALELANYLPYQLLRDTDAMSMAHSLEVRVPLLDDRVVDVALRLRGEPHGKQALAAAAGPVVERAAREPKLTFTLPFDRWLRGPLAADTRDALDVLAGSGLGVERAAAHELWRAFVAGRAGWRPVWQLAVLGRWLGTTP